MVTDVTDGLPEQIPGAVADLPIDEIPGNSVVLRLGENSYVVYAHLQSGSITVVPGQTVQAGTPLGLLGNSGGTTAPHLHIHVVNGPSASSDDGVPYVFDSFGLAGTAERGALLPELRPRLPSQHARL